MNAAEYWACCCSHSWIWLDPDGKAVHETHVELVDGRSVLLHKAAVARDPWREERGKSVETTCRDRLLRHASDQRSSRLHRTVVSVCGTTIMDLRLRMRQAIRISLTATVTATTNICHGVESGQVSPCYLPSRQGSCGSSPKRFHPICLQSAPSSSAPTAATCWTQGMARRMQSSSATSVVPAAKVQPLSIRSHRISV